MLGQIDAGPPEGLIVRRVLKANSGLSGAWQLKRRKLTGQAWREECALADQIVVNSNWSR